MYERAILVQKDAIRKIIIKYPSRARRSRLELNRVGHSLELLTRAIPVIRLSEPALQTQFHFGKLG